MKLAKVETWDNSRIWSLFLAFFFVGYAVLFYYLHMIYRYENVDDAWMLSWAYNFVNRGVANPHIFGDIWGVKGFSMIYALIYGYILNLVGWTKENAHYISFLLGMLSLVIWFKIIKRLYNWKIASIFVMLLCISEPFFGMISQARVEAFGFLLEAMAILSLIYRRHTLTGLFLMLTLENHPATFIMTLSALAAICIVYEMYKDKKFLTSLFIGVGIGIVIYLALHYKYLSSLPAILLKAQKFSQAKTLFPFLQYIKTSRRHALDLAVIVTTLIIHLKYQTYKADKFPITLFIISLLAQIFIPRGNFHYTIYFYPAVILMITTTFTSIQRIYSNAITLLILLFLVKYIFIIRSTGNHPNFSEYIAEVNSIKPHTKKHTILANPNCWFALYDRSDLKCYVNKQSFVKCINQIDRNEYFVILDKLAFRKQHGVDESLLNQTAAQNHLSVQKIYTGKCIDAYLLTKNPNT